MVLYSIYEDKMVKIVKKKHKLIYFLLFIVYFVAVFQKESYFCNR